MTVKWSYSTRHRIRVSRVTFSIPQLVGLREKLQENPIFHGYFMGKSLVSYRFSPKSTHWYPTRRPHYWVSEPQELRLRMEDATVDMASVVNVPINDVDDIKNPWWIGRQGISPKQTEVHQPSRLLEKLAKENMALRSLLISPWNRH